MRSTRGVAAFSALAVLALATSAGAQTRVVTPPGTTTEITTLPTGQQIIRVKVNDESVEFANARPMMLSGRVMVPLRGVVDRLGGDILWKPEERVVTGAQGNNQFRMRVGSREALVNGKMTTLETPPRIVGESVYVPLRFVSEALGAVVRWDNTNRTVVITADGVATEVNPPGN